MPWNGSGAFQRTDGTRTGATVWAQAKAAGVKITTSGHDTHDEDIATGLEACLNRNGENPVTANISWGNNKITSLAAGDASGDAVAYGQSAVQFTSTDAGADTGPVLTLYRNSATPANDDLLGEIRWDGEDSAGNQQEYVNIQAQIAAVTNGAESGRLIVNALQAGTEREVFRLNGADSGLRLKGYGTGATIGPVVTIHRDSSSPADDDVLGGINFDGEDDGGNQTTYAGIEAVSEDVSGGTEDGYLRFRVMRAGSEVTSLSPGIFYSAAAATSGQTVSFTGIPAGARRITVMLMSVSVNGTGSISVQLGDSGGVEATGYLGGFSSIDDTIGNSGFATTAIICTSPSVAADAYSGSVIITLADPATNTWVWQGVFATDANTDIVFHTSGQKSLSGTLDRVQLGSSSDFDGSGKVSVLVE